MATSRTAGGNQVGDPRTFPSGMHNLSRYVHSHGLKFGLYSARCQLTCQKRPASFDFETVDAEQFAAWVQGLRHLFGPCLTYFPALRRPLCAGAVLC